MSGLQQDCQRALTTADVVCSICSTFRHSTHNWRSRKLHGHLCLH